MLYKWDYETHCYKEFPINKDWNCVFYGNLDDIINCAQCGKEIVLGNCYTSLEIHEQVFGFGYSVCEDCHNKEWERRKKYKNE